MSRTVIWQFAQERRLERAVFACVVFACCVPAAAGDLLFKRHALNEQSDYSAAALIDVNHDGRIDIVCGGDWYESPDWKKHFVAEIPRIGGRPDGFSHQEFDVNRDGWTDVITVNWRSQSIKWMEHPGASLGAWTVHTVVEPGPMESGRLVDIDGDGQLDLLPNGGNFAAWWEFRWNTDLGPSQPAWIRHDLPVEARGHGMGFGDIDGDGRGDIVGQNGWLQAPEDRRNGEWVWFAEFNLERASIPMIVADVDDDGDRDIVWCSAHGFGVYWLEQSLAADGQRIWHRHAIDTSWSQGHSPLWVDMDQDGRHELVIGKRYMAHGGADPGEYDPIAIYRYEFNPNQRTWDRWLVSPFEWRVGVGLDPKVGDLDGDGDLDYMASGRSGLYWLENLGAGDSSTLNTETPNYADQSDLLVEKDAQGIARPVEEPEGWGRRRMHIIEAIEKTHGALPTSNARVPLDMEVHAPYSQKGAGPRREEIKYQVDLGRTVSATLFSPAAAVAGETAGIVCMFDPARSALALQVAEELADRGFVSVVPQWTSQTNAGPRGDSALIDLVWQAQRAADLLQAQASVGGEQIGFMGDARQGELGLYLSAIDQRFVASLTDASRLTNPTARSSGDYSLSELLACSAPRSLNIVAPRLEKPAADFAAAAVRAAAVFELRQVPANLVWSNNSFSEGKRAAAYDWLESKFRRRGNSPPASRR